MAKATKKAAKATSTKKTASKAKSAEPKEVKVEKVEKLEAAPAEDFNKAVTASAVTETGSDWAEDQEEDMDAIGNRAVPGQPAVEFSIKTPVPRNGVNPEPGEEYSLMLHFDKTNGQYVASILEFPELVVTGPNKTNVLLELQDKLETHMMEVKRQGQNLPEPIQAKKYPEVLEVPVSQTLFRKLDVLSRQEKISLEKLVGEIVAGAVEKRFDGKRGQENRPQQNFQNNNQPRHNNNNNRHHHNRGHHNQNNNRRPQQGYGNAQGGDNFMEYVRNLEKGGGGNWKKR